MGKKCNWCCKKVELIEKKTYCKKCEENCERECIRCHRPFDDLKYFNKNEKRCDSCQLKYEKEKEKRTKIIETSSNSTDSLSQDSSPSSSDLDDGGEDNNTKSREVSKKRNIVRFDCEKSMKKPKLSKKDLAKIESIYNNKKIKVDEKIQKVQNICTNEEKKPSKLSRTTSKIKQSDMIDTIMKKNSDQLFSEYAKNPILGGRQLGYIIVHKKIPDKSSCEEEKTQPGVGYIPVFF